MISYFGSASNTNNSLNNNPAEEVPQIIFDEISGFLRIEGDSYYEYAVEIFQPLLDKLKEFTTLLPVRKLLIEFSMSYFNTSTSRRFFEIFSILEAYHKRGGKGYVEWFYKKDDQDTLMSGEEFAEQVSFDFQCIPLL